MELPNDVLSIIKEYARPLNQRLISREWLDFIGGNILNKLNVVRYAFAYEINRTIKIILNLEDDDDTYEDLEIDTGDYETDDGHYHFIANIWDDMDTTYYLSFSLEDLYLWDTDSFDEDAFYWGLCKSEYIMTQFSNDSGKVVKVI
jgi:hypothetical protein